MNSLQYRQLAKRVEDLEKRVASLGTPPAPNQPAYPRQSDSKETLHLPKKPVNGEDVA